MDMVHPPGSDALPTLAEKSSIAEDISGSPADQVTPAASVSGRDGDVEGGDQNNHDGGSNDNDGNVDGDGGGDGDGNEGEGGEGRARRPPRPPGSIRKGRIEKRKASWAAKKARAKEKRREERERREEAMRQAGVEIPEPGKNYRDLPREQWSVSQRIRNAKREELEALIKEGGYRVCVDMAFEDVMGEKARASLVQQILYLYGCNRKAPQPSFLTLSGVGPLLTTGIKRLQGFDTWVGVETESRCYTELFDKEELVYLTADSPNTITQLDKKKVYVLGGLVDRNACKGMCFDKATGQGIATAKLPLKNEDLRGTHSTVLATNHVFDILARAMGQGGDLQKIEEKMLPPRKRAGWTGGDDRGPSSKSISAQEKPAGDGIEPGVEGGDDNASASVGGGEASGLEGDERCDSGSGGDSGPAAVGGSEEVLRNAKKDGCSVAVQPGGGEGEKHSQDEEQEGVGVEERGCCVKRGGGEGGADGVAKRTKSADDSSLA